MKRDRYQVRLFDGDGEPLGVFVAEGPPEEVNETLAQAVRMEISYRIERIRKPARRAEKVSQS